MASRSKKIRNFQVEFLNFLNEKNVQEVHIYHHIMNYWSNDSSMPLHDLRDAITDLCNEKLIISKNNAHCSIGVQGISEEDQKNNSICAIQDAGRKFLRHTEIRKKIKNALVILLIAAALYSMWYYRIFSYFFR